MKAFAKFLRILIVVLLLGSVVVAGSFVGVFCLGRTTPDEIYLFDYALVAQKNGDGKLEMWFVHKTDCDSLVNGDGVVYYDGEYSSANAMTFADGTITFFDSHDFTQSVEVDDENIVGEILALWQQK